jgi:UDP-2,3-diacylglucosamine pyrophosphatase LpxH
MVKRQLEICVISDVHLGTYGCHAQELLVYLKSIKTNVLVLNGDFIDAWQFKKNYFPKEHLMVIQEIIHMSTKGTKIYYLTGNHDDILRMFSNVSAGSLYLRDHLEIKINGNKYWFFHGDIFDFSIMISPGLAKLGGRGYDFLIRINRWINNVRNKMGLAPLSLAGQVKSGVKQALKFIRDFEEKAIEEGMAQGYDYVVCGHIHQPQIRKIEKEGQKIVYMNSGDWVENLTALEFESGRWSLYKHEPLLHAKNKKLQVVESQIIEKSSKQITTQEVIDHLLEENNLHVSPFFNKNMNQIPLED